MSEPSFRNLSVAYRDGNPAFRSIAVAWQLEYTPTFRALSVAYSEREPVFRSLVVAWELDTTPTPPTDERIGGFNHIPFFGGPTIASNFGGG